MAGDLSNWPEQSFLTQYVPIAIATIALGVSLYSANLTRKVFIHSSRPYVWASNYGVVDQQNHCIIAMPQTLAYRVKNWPTKIIFSGISITLGAEEIFSNQQENFVRFPDDSSEWSFSIGENEFNEILEKYSSSNAKLFRKVFVKYTSLNGGTSYQFNLKQEFIEADKQWRDIESQAS